MPEDLSHLPEQPPSDTRLEAAHVYYSALRRLGVEGRARRVLGILERQRALMEVGIRYRHPEYGADQVRLAVVRLRLGDRLFAKLFPDIDLVPFV